MAFVRMTSDRAKTDAKLDRRQLDATPEADIARFNVEDGFDPADTLKGLRRVWGPGEIRAKVGLTQAQMAERLRVPVKTWRNWEQGRVALEPAVRSFLALVADDPDRAFRVIDRRVADDPLEDPEGEAQDAYRESLGDLTGAGAPIR